MAFNTNTLNEDGEWTTRTLDINTVLQHYDQQDQEANAKPVEIEKAPVLGLLTQTVIRSPLAHWILSARLRSPDSNDVAFIGDGFIQIKELRPDGHLWDVVYKEDFGARIRNARIVGSLDAYARDCIGSSGRTQIKDEDEDVDMDDEEPRGGPWLKQNPVLPPQVILLQLDTGDSVFLMLRQSRNMEWKFISSRHRVSKSMDKKQPGMHLVVDPSSRYMAIGCSEGLFAIYALHPREELKKQYAHSSNLRYVASERHIYLKGTILKMEFLYPAAGDDDHIILLVILVFKGKSRMLLYEWQTGQDLRDIRAHNQRGHLLDEDHRMPSLVIPLTLRSAFILVFETFMAIYKGLLIGSLEIYDFPLRDFRYEKENRVLPHHGLHSEPLWTAWARPTRTPQHARHHDEIYMVREDGLLILLDTYPEDNLLNGLHEIGCLRSHCGPALAVLDYNGYDCSSGDYLIAGGESCIGGAYLIEAREEPVFKQSIENWAPAQDLVTTSGAQDSDTEPTNQSYRGTDAFPRPDRMYACVGKGSQGSVLEFRHGFEAHIALETDYETPVMDVWALLPAIEPSVSKADCLFLLSLGDRSALLALGEAGDLVEIEETSTLDLSHRTISAGIRGNFAIQVTEASISITDSINNIRLQNDNIFGVYQGGVYLGAGKEIGVAVIHDSVVLFTVRFDNSTYLQVLDLDKPEFLLEMIVRTIGKYSNRVTVVRTCLVKQLLCAIVAEFDGGSSRLTFQPINGGNSHTITVPSILGYNNLYLEEFVSMEIVPGQLGHILLLCGTRNGVVVVLRIDEDSLQILESTCHRVGATPVLIKREESGSKELFLANCDSKLYALRLATSRMGITRPDNERFIDQIWLTDAESTGRQQPNINSVVGLPQGTGGINDGILIIDGSQLIVAGLSTQSKTVPRQIPIGGTPSRLLYSQTFECLIVAATIDGKSALKFLDPVTGQDIAWPFVKWKDPAKKQNLDKKKDSEKKIYVPLNSGESVPGLGNTDDKIFRLMEWTYVKDGQTWIYLVVCTSAGRLLLIDVKNLDDSDYSKLLQREGTSPIRPRLRYLSKHRFKVASQKPIYSVAGSESGLYYCAGNVLHFDILDESQHGFVNLAKYELPSPALNLVYEDGKIYALTSAHSLEILEVVTETTGTEVKFIRTHGDQVTRHSLHHRVIGLHSESPLNLISDKACSIAGLWATRNTNADTLDTVFEAELPYSIVKFRFGKCRPIWDPIWSSTDSNRVEAPTSPLVTNSANYPEILGLSIDGSLCHFMVLDYESWKFLRFLLNLAMQSSDVCEFTDTSSDIGQLQPILGPKVMMQVDGDILRRCLENRYLEDLLQVNADRGNAKEIQATFRSLLQGLHRGSLGNHAPLSTLVERAYTDLEFFLRPVF